MIVADALGYSDLGALGGEIETPNLDALVGEGRILTNHHVATVSAPMRAMLMSGTDHHLVGLGQMQLPLFPDLAGLLGYEGYLNDRSLSVAELLQDAGYHTHIAGKWHLGSSIVGGAPNRGLTPDQWGFEHSYTVLGGGAANHFGRNDAIREQRIKRLRKLGLLKKKSIPAETAPETLTQAPATPNYNTPSAQYINALNDADDGYVDHHAPALFGRPKVKAI